jgi:Ras-related protein Rab-11A
LSRTKPTVGVEFTSKAVQMENNKLVRAQIWDSSGQERYQFIPSSYYHRALDVLIIYGITNCNSFDNLLKWLRKVNEVADKDCLVVLVGNKIDLHWQHQAVLLQHGRYFAMQHEVTFIYASAKDDVGADASFQHLL